MLNGTVITGSREEKARIQGRIVSVLSAHKDLASAFVATLGGEGLETFVWEERGIDPDRAFLIEADTGIASLLVRQRMHCRIHHGPLASFPETLRVAFGDSASLDLLHVDLCGSIRTCEREIEQVLPVLERGAGILAVTVVDARLTLDPAAVRSHADMVFGRDARLGIWSSLVSVHQEVRRINPHATADPEKASARELDFLSRLAMALTHAKVSRHVGYLERYLYASGVGRMRTYVMHLAPVQVAPSLGEHAQALHKALAASTCFWVSGENMEEVRPELETEEPRVKAMTSETRDETRETTMRTREDDFFPNAWHRLAPAFRDQPDKLAMFRSLFELAQSVIDARRLLAAKVDADSQGEELTAARAENAHLRDELERKAYDADGFREQKLFADAELAQMRLFHAQVRQELQTIMDLAQPLDQRLRDLAQKLGYKNVPSFEAVTQPAPVAPQPPDSIIDRLINEAWLRAEKAKKAHSMPDSETRDGLRLYLFRETKTGRGQAARTRVLEVPGLWSRHALYSVLAVANGAHAPGFWAKLLLRTEEAKRPVLASELAALYDVTPETILARARASKYWRRRHP